MSVSLARRYAGDSGTEDMLILVDPEDNVLGHREKASCHQGEGHLHRAFSIFIFNRAGYLLLQQRSEVKPLWPLFWSNSVCSHPRKGEETAEAAARRLPEEIGIRTEVPLRFLFKFQYQAQFQTVGSENELCSVFIGRSNREVTVDSREIAATRCISPESLDRELLETPDIFTPWFKQEWQRIRQNHMKDILGLAHT